MQCKATHLVQIIFFWKESPRYEEDEWVVGTFGLWYWSYQMSKGEKTDIFWVVVGANPLTLESQTYARDNITHSIKPTTLQPLPPLHVFWVVCRTSVLLFVTFVCVCVCEH